MQTVKIQHLCNFIQQNMDTDVMFTREVGDPSNRLFEANNFHFKICNLSPSPPAGELVEPGGGEALVLLTQLHHLVSLLCAIHLNPTQICRQTQKNSIINCTEDELETPDLSNTTANAKV